MGHNWFMKMAWDFQVSTHDVSLKTGWWITPKGSILHEKSVQILFFHIRIYNSILDNFLDNLYILISIINLSSLKQRCGKKILIFQFFHFKMIIILSDIKNVAFSCSFREKKDCLLQKLLEWVEYVSVLMSKSLLFSLWVDRGLKLIKISVWNFFYN